MAVNFKKTKVPESDAGIWRFACLRLRHRCSRNSNSNWIGSKSRDSIKRIDAETSAPVQIISREDIQNSGKTTIQEVLRSVTADSTGSIPTSFTNGFASGSAAVSLRGLGVNSTLVLLNGRRMTTYGLADDGTRNFVDLNTLPLEAVDRIEVLKEGASAIYGADAVGGVVNVILRKSYTGASVGGSYGQTGDSDGNDIRGWGSFGFGDLAKTSTTSSSRSRRRRRTTSGRRTVASSARPTSGRWDTTTSPTARIVRISVSGRRSTRPMA